MKREMKCPKCGWTGLYVDVCPTKDCLTLGSEMISNYATAQRDGFTVPLIGIPASAQPSSGDFREDTNPCSS
jgi:hypothetical protein